MNDNNHDSIINALQFDHSFTEHLPADLETENFTRQVHKACFSYVKSRDFPKATLAHVSEPMLSSLGLKENDTQHSDFLKLVTGQQCHPSLKSYAQCYGGHQFGNWAGQLGDGRAINLGTVANNGQHWALQLKGAGPTPYSRRADGLAVMRSSIREYLCSEAMFHLGVPTTRALSLVATNEGVERDMFYDGHPKMEPGAIVCRASPSFLRFGSFEIFSARQDYTSLQKLVDYTISQDFPHLGKPSKDTTLAWFNEVCQRTAELMVQWMRVGFVHGVMNTDNMSILGLTIDYGPYGWLENYDPEWTPNTTDAEGRRYRFGQQPRIGLWNLVQLANALYPLIEDLKGLEHCLEEYTSTYEVSFHSMMAAKLGLKNFNADEDSSLINSLLDILPKAEIDMTLFFRHLASINTTSPVQDKDLLSSPLGNAFYDDSPAPAVLSLLSEWLQAYQQRLLGNEWSDGERQQHMNNCNPLYVLRNYLAQLAIDKAEQGDFSGVNELMQTLQTPYLEQAGKNHLAEKRPEWARHRAGCSMLSCSS